MASNTLVVIKRKRALYFGLLENRKSATGIEAILAGEDYISSFLILSGQQHLANWYRVPKLDPRTAIHISSSGYLNNEISFEWLKHFDLHTFNRTVGRKRLLILDSHGFHHTKQFI